MGKKKKSGAPAAAHNKGDAARKPAKPEGHKASGAKSHVERVLWRYAAVALVMGVLLWVYTQHPYYGRKMFQAWGPFFRGAFIAWLVLGIPYVHVTLGKFGGRKMDLTDGAMMWGALFRGIFNWLMEGCRWPSHVWRNRRMRTTVLSLGVKAFFTPLMFVFLNDHLVNMRNLWWRRKGVEVLTDAQIQSFNANPPLEMVEAWWNYFLDVWPRVAPSISGALDSLQVWTWTRGDLMWTTDMYYQLLFFVDCIWAFFGYSMESRWLDNKTKSVEPTGFGWMVALMCYPPFNDISGTYFPLGKSQPLFTDPTVLMGFKMAMLAAFTIYVWATLAFGPRFSNLTHRGIVQRGPYAWIRHPAYACKNFAWWMEHLPYAGAVNGFLGVNWANLLWLVVWNVIYGLRAWTEERHLSRDPVYRDYKKKVKWAAIPGVF